ITRSQLAVDGEVEERQLSRTEADLQSYPDRPDIFQLQRSFLPHQLALVPGSLPQCTMNRLVHDGLPSFVDDQSTLGRRRIVGVRPSAEIRVPTELSSKPMKADVPPSRNSSLFTQG